MRASAIALALYALLFPFLALELDHHFAERGPDHEHLYLSGLVQNHVHPYEVAHTDSPRAPEAHDAMSYEVPKGHPAPEKIVYLSSNNGMTQGSALLTVPLIHVSMDFLNPEDSRPTIGLPTGDTIFQDPYLPLPKQPPRV